MKLLVQQKEELERFTEQLSNQLKMNHQLNESPNEHSPFANRDNRPNTTDLLTEQTWKQQIDELRDKNASLQQELSKDHSRLDQMKWETSLAEQNLRNEVSLRDTKLEHLESHLQQKGKEVQELKENLRSMETKLDEAKVKCDSLSQLNARLEVQLKNFESQNES
ncbi:viral A-type inclusion protein, partial [Reticulomyxa filosa]